MRHQLEIEAIEAMTVTATLAINNCKNSSRGMFSIVSLPNSKYQYNYHTHQIRSIV